MKTSKLSLREEVDEEIFRVYFRDIELGELNVPQLRLDTGANILSTPQYLR